MLLYLQDGLKVPSLPSPNFHLPDLMRFCFIIRADKKFLSAVFIIAFQFLSLQLWAQSESVSPYSRYGIGDIPFNGFIKNIGMGGTGIAMRPNFNITITNP